MSEDNFDEELDGDGEVIRHQRDDDDAYDRYRDDACNDLQNELEMFCIDYSKKKGYYHNSIDKIKQHINVLTR